MRILFICRGNVARSQEAAFYYNRFAGSDVATSAGIEAIIGKPIHPLVTQVMTEDGFDMSAAFRKPLAALDIDAAEQIISFVPLEELPEEARHKTVFWDVADPRGADIDTQRRTRDDIKRRVKELYAHQR